jgi:hypothetical protein
LRFADSQSRPIPNSHVVSIDSIFGDDFDASAILPPAKKAATNNFASQSMDVEQEVTAQSKRFFVLNFREFLCSQEND